MNRTKCMMQAVGMAVAMMIGISSAGPQEKPAAARTNSLGMEFMAVPGVDALFCRWETRVADFEAFVKDTGYDAIKGSKGGTWKNPGAPYDNQFKQEPTHPVCCVSYEDAKAFCEWLTKKERGAGLLKTNEAYRLPRDREWSVAVGLEGKPESAPGKPKPPIGLAGWCGEEKGYPWGNEWPPSKGSGNYAGAEAKDAAAFVIPGYNDGFARTAPVGSFAANKFGLFDMGGNVSEMCDTPFTDGESALILRGGSWCDANENSLRSSYRARINPGNQNGSVGFRIVLSIASP